MKRRRVPKEATESGAHGPFFYDVSSIFKRGPPFYSLTLSGFIMNPPFLIFVISKSLSCWHNGINPLNDCHLFNLRRVSDIIRYFHFFD